MNFGSIKLTNLVLVTSLIILFSCSDLSVQNQNEPDRERTQLDEASMQELSNDLFRRWYVTVHGFRGLQMATAVGADAATACLCPNGAQIMGKEPRLTFDNTPNSSFSQTSAYFYNEIYEINSLATDILKHLENGQIFSDGTDIYNIRAQSKLIQGLSTGYIALLYDQGFIYDESSADEEILDPTLLDYTEVMDHAISKLEEVISISENNTFSVDNEFLSVGVDGNKPVDNVFLKEITHSFIARFLANEPRTNDQLANVDWSAVKFHAENGVKTDFTIYTNNQISGGWYNQGLMYLIYPGFGRVDHYVINMMNPSYPAHNSDGKNYPPPNESEILENPELDDRLLSDYEYLYDNNFPADRGVYFLSNFRYSRYDDYLYSNSGSQREITTSELNMYIAEAMLNQSTPNLNAASSIINSSERISRGRLEPVQATEQDIWSAIHHERMVEQFNTGTGNEFFHMRKYDLLQKGTLLHFPLPADIQRIAGFAQPFYTFGGETNADGNNTSDGGWKID